MLLGENHVFGEIDSVFGETIIVFGKMSFKDKGMLKKLSEIRDSGIFTVCPKINAFGKYFYVFGDFIMFLGKDTLLYALQLLKFRRLRMRKKNFKGRTEKRRLAKCKEVCKTYDAIQYAYAEILSTCPDVTEFRCNVLMEGLQEGDYTTDFVCTKQDEDLMVRECVFRKLLEKPMTVKLLEASRTYWLKHGVTDWGLVIDAEK